MLRETGSTRATEFRCPFHGFAWNIDGTLRHIPCQWDFPHISPSAWSLPEAKVGTWGGFVFLNPDLDAAPLADFLGNELSDQFKRWPLELRYKQAHVAKILRCNWKVAQEAFMEAFHVVATHPQLLAGIGDANSQYDAWGNFSRAITANGTPSPHLSWKPSEQEMFDSMTDRRLDEPPLAEIGGELSARIASAAGAREMIGEGAGIGNRGNGDRGWRDGGQQPEAVDAAPTCHRVPANIRRVERRVRRAGPARAALKTLRRIRARRRQ